MRESPGEADIFSMVCPSRDVLDLIADKWTVLTLSAIRAGVDRNGLLLRAIDGISQRMLTHTLRQLERNGLLTRIKYAEVPPRVEYRLTALGVSVTPLLQHLCDWSIQHMGRIREVREAYDRS